MSWPNTADHILGCPAVEFLGKLQQLKNADFFCQVFAAPVAQSAKEAIFSVWTDTAVLSGFLLNTNISFLQ